MPLTQLTPSRQALICVKQCVHSPVDEGDSKNFQPCSRLLARQIGRFHVHRSNAQTHTTRHRTQIAIQLAIVFCERGRTETASFCSKLPNLHPHQNFGAMADIIVTDKYVKVNTQEDKCPGVFEAMKIVLGSAALNSD